VRPRRRGVLVAAELVADEAGIYEGDHAGTAVTSHRERRRRLREIDEAHRRRRRARRTRNAGLARTIERPRAAGSYGAGRARGGASVAGTTAATRIIARWLCHPVEDGAGDVSDESRRS
jgi:hypothetical protein